MKIDIIDETTNFIIINKPSGLRVHGGEHNVLTVLAQQTSGTQTFDLVHRLDKETSGLLILSKNKDCTRAFYTLFEQHKISKTYLAISDKKPKKKQGAIIGDMQKSRNGSYKLTRATTAPATTYFRSVSLSPNRRLFVLFPRTGKTHQLRVALKSISAPILGDKRYGGIAADRMYLHAFSLSFTLFERNFTYSLPVCESQKGLQWPASTFYAEHKDLLRPSFLSTP